MAEGKTVAEFERDRGIMVRGADPEQVVTEAQFNELTGPHFENAVGIDHAAREAWLKEQGYEVTRENMMDGSLPSKQAER